MKKIILVFVLLFCFTSASVFALTWTKQAGATPWPIEMHGVVIGGGYVFIIGGYAPDSVGLHDQYAVYSAPFDSNGNIGTWTQTLDVLSCSNDPGTESDSAYIEFSCFEANGYVYRIGGGWNWGNTNGDNNGDSLWGKIETGGIINSWGRLTPFPTGQGTGGLWAPATYTVINGTTFVYVVSGQADDNLTPKVFRSIADPATGTLSSWVEMTNVPNAMYFNSAFIVKDQLYTFSGLTVNGNSNTGRSNLILKTTINGDGSLQTWTTSTTPYEMMGLYGSAVAASKHVVYIIGGRQRLPVADPGSGGTTSGKMNIYHAVIDPSGNMGDFVSDGLLSYNTTSAAMWYTPAIIRTIGKQERIFIIGGRYGTGTGTSNLVSSEDFSTNASGISSTLFVSEPVYTLPTAIGNGTFTPGQIKEYSVADGTGPFTWTSSDTSIVRINTYGGTTAIVEAVGLGSATITVSDAYSDTDSISCLVTATGTPLFKEVEPRKYIRFELFN